MTPVDSPWWYGLGALGFLVALVLTRSVEPRALRLGVRSLVLAAVVAPQPPWAPGDGGFLLPAAWLLSPRHPGFGFLNGLMPILSVTAILFTVGGHALRIRREPVSARAHDFVQRWVLVGIVIPLVALVLVSPFLAFFLFGGVLAGWSAFSLVCLLGSAGIDRRIAKRTGGEPRSTWSRRTSAALLGSTVALALLAILVRGV